MAFGKLGALGKGFGKLGGLAGPGNPFPPPPNASANARPLMGKDGAPLLARADSAQLWGK